jgi:hypothetical protein
MLIEAITSSIVITGADMSPLLFLISFLISI